MSRDTGGSALDPAIAARLKRDAQGLFAAVWGVASIFGSTAKIGIGNSFCSRWTLTPTTCRRPSSISRCAV